MPSFAHKVFAAQLPRERRTTYNNTPENVASHVRKVMRADKVDLSAAVFAVAKLRNLPINWVRDYYETDEIIRSWDE